MVEKIDAQSQTVLYIRYIKVLSRTDFEHLFLNYFESELIYRDGPSIKNVSFVRARKECYIFKIVKQSP